MMKILVTAREFPKYYNKELYVLWTSTTPNGKIFYHCSDKPDDLICKIYLGENQIKITKS